VIMKRKGFLYNTYLFFDKLKKRTCPVPGNCPAKEMSD